MNLGLVLSSGYIAAAAARGDRVTRSVAKRDRRAAEEKAYDCVSLVVDEFGGGKVGSVRVATDAVRAAIDSPRHLGRVVLLRLSGPEGRESPPLLPDAISKKVLTIVIASGGRGFDGRTIAPVNEDEVKEAYRTHRGEGVSFVVSSPFSNLYPEQELKARDQLVRLGAKNVWATSDLSSLPSVLDRESTAVLSAASSRVISDIEKVITSIFSRKHLAPKIYFGRNNGTVASAAYTRTHPLETYWSVEGCSISGASMLAKTGRLMVAGSDRRGVWFGGSEEGLPIIGQIAYVRDALVHVQSPMLAEVTGSIPESVKASLYSMFADVVGSPRTIAVGPEKAEGYPMSVERIDGSESAAAIGAALAGVRLDMSVVRPKGSDVAEAKSHLRSGAKERLRLMGAMGPSVRLSSVRVEPGYNLPEGSIRLSLLGSAKAG